MSSPPQFSVITKSVPTWHSTCLVSVVSASVTSTFKLGVNADRSCVIHLKVHHNAGCRQLSGGAHSLIVQPSSVPHYAVFYVQHKLGAGNGGNTADASVYRVSIGFGSLNDNISFVCLQPDSLLWRWFFMEIDK